VKQASEHNPRVGANRVTHETIAYLLAACLSVWFLVLLPKEVGQPVTLFGAAPEGLSPDAMPRIVLLAIVVTSIIGVAISFKKGSGWISRPSLNVLVTCVASFIFAALLVPLGFVVASALTVVLLAVFLRGRSPIALALSGFVVPVGIYLIFTRVLYIALPAGFLGI